MNKTFTLGLLSAACLLPAHAQDRADAAQAAATARAAHDAAAQARADAWVAASQAQFEREVAIGEALEATMGVAGEMGPQRVVKGAPYCAEAVHETVQWLADGSGGAPNRIVRAQTTRLCRDGEGRTRQEVDRGGRKLVYLRDPVAREGWVLDTDRKLARRLGSGRHIEITGADSEAWREYADKLREWGRQFGESMRANPNAPAAVTPPTPPVPPAPAAPVAPVAPVAPPSPGAAPVVITRSDDAPGHRTETREVRVLRVPGGATGDWALPAPVQQRALQFAPRGAGAVTPLPSKDIEGVRANGERTSWTIEAGKVGNEKPIVITREVWTAPDLMLTVMSRDFDPRSGEVNYRLRNIKRGEPDAALMKVPADFTKPAPRTPKAG